MTYPQEFSRTACDDVEAEALKAERDLRRYRDTAETRPERAHTLKPNGVRRWTDDEEDIIEYVLRVGVAFGLKACELGSQGWSIDRIRRDTNEFLRLLTIDSNRKYVREMRRCEFIGTVGNVQAELMKEFEKSAGWQRFEDALLAIADRPKLQNSPPCRNENIGPLATSMNITSQQKDLLFAIVDAHISGGEPFNFVRNVSEGFLVYERGPSIKVHANEGDFHQLAGERLVTLVFEPHLGGKPTQLGIDTAASLRESMQESTLDDHPAAGGSASLRGGWNQGRLCTGDAIVSLRKPNGTTFNNLDAHFSPKAILIMNVAIPIEPGDMLIRALPTGIRVGFIVDDPGYREALGSIPARFEVEARLAAPIESLERADFWRARRTDFEQLADRQREVLGINKEHPKWLRGYCSRIDDDELAQCEVNGGFDTELRSKFEEVATQAAVALGSPPDCEPVKFWVSCLCLDIIQNSPEGVQSELLQSVESGGFIRDLLGSSAAYCSRLGMKAVILGNDPRLSAEDVSAGGSRVERLSNPFLESDPRHESWAAFAEKRVPNRLKSAVDDAAGDNERINGALTDLMKAPPSERQQLWKEVLPTLHRRQPHNWPETAPPDDNQIIEALRPALTDEYAAVLGRLDTLADEARRQFVVSGEDIGPYIEMVRYLVQSALALFPAPSDQFREQASEIQRRWEAEARELAQRDATPPQNERHPNSPDNAGPERVVPETEQPALPRTPRRTPDLESSRARVDLVGALARELAAIKQDLRGYCSLADLKQKHPGFVLWKHIEETELKELVDGATFTPKAYAESLTLRVFGITSRQTLKKDRSKLRKAQRDQSDPRSN